MGRKNDNVALFFIIMTSINRHDFVMRERRLQTKKKLDDDIAPRQSESNRFAFGHAFGDDAKADFRLPRAADGINQCIYSMSIIRDDAIGNLFLLRRQRIFEIEDDVLGKMRAFFCFLSAKSDAFPAIRLPMEMADVAEIAVPADWTNKSSHTI